MIRFSKLILHAALVGILALAVGSKELAAQAPAVVVTPSASLPGAIVRLALNDATSRGDTIIAIHASMAGEPLHFIKGDSGRYHAIGAVPVEASDSVPAVITVERSSGTIDTIHVTVVVPRSTQPKEEAPLAVDERFTRPLEPATEARIERENEKAREVGRHAHDSPPMWTKPFLRPRDTRITSRFGTGRMFNGTLASRHLGVDYAGAPGAPVRAANRGVVALVDTFFLAGRVIYIDHGGGVMTGYFHLTKPLVAKGDTVARGQRIGTVGATGRVTGPHLHWSARYGALTVNPLDLMGLDPRLYGASRRP
jgi:murein DD-endopeptidase MepM/ murein hydrolase activator NlpD